jgi:hypothetical protein
MRKRVPLLEDDADVAAQLVEVGAAGVDVDAVDDDAARYRLVRGR